MRKVAIFVLLTFPLVCWAGFGLPNLGNLRLPVHIKIPDLSNLLNPNNDPITTSIKDAITGVPFLDAYNPGQGALIGLVPHGPDGTMNMMPGLWEGTFESFCLHAGTHGPTRGDGYLYAPLKGPLTPTLEHILRALPQHPEIPERDAQELIWALLARTKVSQCPQNLQRAAAALMTQDEIDKADGGALGKLPPEVLNRAMAGLPPVAQEALHADDTIRGMLTGAVSVPYSELEKVAVLTGPVAPPKGSRDVPSGRWSYLPGGYFARFLPYWYGVTRRQWYDPEQFKFGADAKGRLTSIEGPQGVRVETTYDDAAGALSFDGDGGTKGYAFASIKLTGPAPDKPGQMKTVEVANRGWTMVGAPNGDGQAGAAGDQFAGAQNRYNWAVARWKRFNALNVEIGKLHPKRAVPKSSELGNLMDLASYAEGLRAAVAGDSDEAKWEVAQLGVVYRAWMSQAVLLGGQTMLTDNGTRLAAVGDFRIAGRLRTWNNSGGGGFGGGAGGTAAPANTGQQRLAQSNAKTNDGNGKKGTHDAAKSLSAFANAVALTKSAAVAIPNEAYPTPSPSWPVGILAGKLYHWIVNTGHKMCNALEGDPPRDDYQLIATPATPKIPLVKPHGKMTQADADAVNALMQASVPLAEDSRAVYISRDRYGGAVRAGDQAAAYRQLCNATKWERASGFAMLATADKMEALLKLLDKEGYQSPYVTHQMVTAYQAQLRTKGYSAKDLAAARMLGLTDADIQSCKALDLEPIHSGGVGSLTFLASDVVASFRELGAKLAAMPVVQVPAG